MVCRLLLGVWLCLPLRSLQAEVAAANLAAVPCDVQLMAS